MNGVANETELRLCQFRELLLGHLQAARQPAWPGADGLTVTEVLLSYPRAAAAGLVPDRDQLLAAHPDLVAEVAAMSWGGHAVP